MTGQAGLRFFPAGDRVLTWSGAAAIVWSAESGEAVMEVYPDGGVHVARVFPDGERIVTCTAGAICTEWTVGSGGPLRELPRILPRQGSGAIDHVTVEVFPSGGALLLVGGGRAKAWELSTGSAPIKLAIPGFYILGATIFPDGAHIATMGLDDKWAVVWESASGKIKFEVGHRDNVMSLAVFAKGLLIATLDKKGRIAVWNAITGVALRQLRPWRGLTTGPFGFETFAGSDRLATFTPQAVVVWSATSGVVLRQLAGAPHNNTAVAVSPGGDALASCGRGRVTLWDLRSGRLLQTLVVAGEAPAGDRCYVAFGPAPPPPGSPAASIAG